jgi:hypothetical protein
MELYQRIRGGSSETGTNFANPLAEGDVVEGGRSTIERRIEMSAEHTSEKVTRAEIGGVDHGQAARTLASLEGMGALSSQGLLFISWVQNFSLVSLLACLPMSEA